MSTKFYMHTQRKDLKPYFGSDPTLVDEPDFGYEIKIAHTAGGWQPCFYAHEYIRSVSDLRLLFEKGGVRIYDEYHRDYTWAEFEQRVINWGNKTNWRTAQNNDCGTTINNEFTSVDGYRFHAEPY